MRIKSVSQSVSVTEAAGCRERPNTGHQRCHSSVLSALENIRSQGGFQKIFAEASLLTEHHGIAVSSPRLSKGRSVHRPTVGVEGDCAEAYTESTVINSEYILWRQQWTATSAEQRPDAATAALSSCSSVKFPNVSTDCCPSYRNAARNDVRV